MTNSNPEITAVCAVINNRGGEVLAVTRPFRDDLLGLPGGHIDPGETPEEAIVREIYEETGLRAHSVSQIYLGFVPAREKGSGESHWVQCFQVDSWGGTPASPEVGTKSMWTTWDVLCSKGQPYALYNYAVKMQLKELDAAE
tara:strand:+ start:14626 stop:15051 length:426 start_codon:yes stop_codon:yes gene_type:complete